MLNKDWRNYNRFRPINGINSLFYLTQAVNFERYGRRGTSPYVGTGNYKLSNWWHLSWFSIYLTKKLGVFLPILCMIGFVISHLIWLNHPDVKVGSLLIVLTLIFFSTYYFGGSFVFLNYNVVGWLFMPIGLYFILDESYVLAGVAWFLASQGSITVIFISSILSIVISLYSFSPLPLLAISPAILKIFSHFLYVDNLVSSIIKIVSAIGLSKKSTGTKYEYPKKSYVFHHYSVYFLGTWASFISILFLNDKVLFGLLSSTILTLWVLNSSFARFSDPQSLYMAMFSVGAASIILTPNLYLYLMFWICISPPPDLLGVGSAEKNFIRPKSLKPFPIVNLLNKGKEFVHSLPESSRVLLVLNDPGREYSKIFDGYRVIYELLFYLGNLHKIHFFPDWWAVFENNKIESPGFWGISPQDAIQNLESWKGSHVIVYQETGTKLDTQWTKAGFAELSTMDWQSLFEGDLDRTSCWGNKPIPKWFLLQPPAVNNRI